MSLYNVSNSGGAFADDDENPTVEISVTELPDAMRRRIGYAVEGDLYPYRKYDNQGRQNGDFSDFQFTMNREEMTGFRDMLTEILDRRA